MTKFKVGQTVRVVFPGDYWTGKIGKVVSATHASIGIVCPAYGRITYWTEKSLELLNA
jgi:hypothetical protein